MKLTKTLIASILALSLVLALAACGGSENPGSEEDTSRGTTSATTSESNGGDTTPAVTEDDPTPSAPAVDWDLASTAPAGLSAAPESDFEYTYSTELSGIVITKYRGNNASVLIPDTIEDEPVVRIDRNAFQYVNELEYLYFPESLQEISGTAFSNCPNLTLVVPESVTVTESNIGTDVKNLAFGDNAIGTSVASANVITFFPFFKNLLNNNVENVKYGDDAYPVNENTVSELYTKITGGDFETDSETVKSWQYKHVDETLEIRGETYEMKGIAIVEYINNESKIKLTVPSEIEGQPVVIIGDSRKIFNGSRGDSIIELTLPEGVMQIKAYAFKDAKFQTINLPNSLISIQGNVFEGHRFESIALPDGIKEFGTFVDGTFVGFRISPFGGYATNPHSANLVITYKGVEYGIDALGRGSDEGELSRAING